eukprot:scaffold10681_cov71-Phaeocystis_antarctica.AAC.2
MGAAWPRHAARRTPRAAGGAASTSARSKAPRPPASEEHEYMHMHMHIAPLRLAGAVVIWANGIALVRIKGATHDNED